MKKLLLLVTIVSFGFYASAQEVHFGVKAGLSLANFIGDIENNDMKTGFHVGGVAEIMFNDKFGIQPELLYSSQGSQEDIGGDKFKYNLDYINVPVMVKYYVMEGLSVETGPQVGYLVSSKVSFDGDSEDLEGLSDIDFGLNFGAGYKLENGLNFSGRYNLGLINVNDEEGRDFKNSVIQLSVGYMF